MVALRPEQRSTLMAWPLEAKRRRLWEPDPVLVVTDVVGVSVAIFALALLAVEIVRLL